MEIRTPLTSIALFFLTVNCALGSYNVPFEEDPWNEARKFRPIDYMVDITNYLGLNVLYEHNFLNDNNIAFSPYGLTGILIALYEGVDGVSSMQIKESMGLPNDKSVMRVGFRDIHRRLRSYFIPKEGFLAGLAFNNENVTFRNDYKNVLNFYGYFFDVPKPMTTQPIQTSTERISTAMNSAITAGPSNESKNSFPTTDRSSFAPSDMTTSPEATSTPIKMTTASSMPTASPLSQNSPPENEGESATVTELPKTTQKIIQTTETTTLPTTVTTQIPTTTPSTTIQITTQATTSKPPTTQTQMTLPTTTQVPTTVLSTTIQATTQATTTKPPTTQTPLTLPPTTLPPTTVPVTTQATTTQQTTTEATTTPTTTQATTTTAIPTTKPPTTLAATTVTTSTTTTLPPTTTTLATTQSTSTVATTVLTTTETTSTMDATQTASTRVTRSTDAQTTTIKQTTNPMSTNTAEMINGDDENLVTAQESIGSTVSEKKQSEMMDTTEARQPTTVTMNDVTTKMPSTVQATDPPKSVTSISEPVSDTPTTGEPSDKLTEAITEKEELTTELSNVATRRDELEDNTKLTTVTEMDSTTMFDQSDYEKTTIISYGSTTIPEKPLTRKKKSIFHYDLVSPTYQDHFAFYRPVFLRNPNYEGRGLQHQRSFLANGYSKVQITYMTYDTVLEFAYIPYLKSLALKLPLDTSEYYLLILLPEYEFGVNQLIKDLHSERSPSLKQINYMLTNTYVRAWVPSFMLKGFIVLTSDLQKLGICDAFEPRQDDFKPMTNEKISM